jgi:3-oxoadipate enol-lactonase
MATVFFGPSLGGTSAMWAPVLPLLDAANTYRVVELPGHGGAPVPAEPFTLADRADAIVALADELGVERFDFAGVSISGAIALALALRHPDRVRTVAVICSAPKLGTAESWAQRATIARARGVASMLPGLAERWFTAGFAQREPDILAAIERDFAAVDAEGYARCCEALGSFDVRDELSALRVPTLLLTGANDPGVPLESSMLIAQNAPAGLVRHEVIERASHIPMAEQPATVARLLTAWWATAAA